MKSRSQAQARWQRSLSPVVRLGLALLGCAPVLLLGLALYRINTRCHGSRNRQASLYAWLALILYLAVSVVAGSRPKLGMLLLASHCIFVGAALLSLRKCNERLWLILTLLVLPVMVGVIALTNPPQL